jgi:hypothetical protein
VKKPVPSVIESAVSSVIVHRTEDNIWHKTEDEKKITVTGRERII